MAAYIEEKENLLDNLNKKYTEIVHLINSKKINNYNLNRFELIKKELDNLENNIDEFKNELEIKYTKKADKDLLYKIEEMNKYNKNIKLLYPYMVMLNLVSEEHNYIKCSECNKTFFGKDYLRRFRQHFHKKHNN